MYTLFLTTVDCLSVLFHYHATENEIGKHAVEVGSGVEGGGDANNSKEYIVWNKDLADTDYLDELVKKTYFRECSTKEGLVGSSQIC